MLKRLLILGIALSSSYFSHAQQRQCATDEVHERLLQNNPDYARRQAEIESLTNRFAKNPEAYRQANGQIIIPCIIHVVYSNSQQNISDAQIQSQIDRLNKDYGATNSDYNNVPSQFTTVRSGDTDVRFEILEIKRHSDSRSEWGTNDAVKSAYPPIEPDRILNMWVANIGGGILGYAQFPGGSPSTDGVVMSPQYFGDASVTGGSNFYLSAPFDRGRTATHEVGHWLNLRHIWGDGGCNVDDYVSDTPVAGNPNYGCPADGTNSCSGGESDMFMNYMDYVDDACMFMFSAGQDTRMQATFASGGGREGFLLDPVYTPGGGGGGGGTTGNVTLTLTFDKYPEETSWQILDGSTIVESGGTYGSQPDNSTLTIDLNLVDGCYDFVIKDAYGDGICCSYGNGSYTLASSDGTVLASGGSFGSSETKNFCIGDTGGGGGGGSTLNCTTTISSLPYSESYESGLGAWTQGTGDDINWTRDASGTPSSSTGPSSGSAGSYYMYVEASSPNYPSKVAILDGPCYDLSSATNATFEFDYHMYGSSMGTLELQAMVEGGTWTTLWSKSGNQSNTWHTATIDMASFLGGSVQVRFKGTTGSNYTSDMAIDNVNFSTASGGGTGTTTANLSITLDNYPEETSWEIKSGSTVIASGGTYGSQPDGSTVTEEIVLNDGCYDFVIKDAYGDGICCSYGSGSYSLTANGTVLASGGSFGSSETTNFCVGSGTRGRTVSIVSEGKAPAGFNLFPNPATNQLTIFTGKMESPEFMIMSSTGAIYKQGVLTETQTVINVSDLESGFYFVRVTDGQNVIVNKVVIR